MQYCQKRCHRCDRLLGYIAYNGGACIIYCSDCVVEQYSEDE